MRITRREVLAAALLAPCVARAQDGFPNRAVRLIVPYSAGGIADTVARIVQPKVGEALGQSLIIENKTGASGALGAAAAAQSPPDGYTLVLEGATTITSPLVNKLPAARLRDAGAGHPADRRALCPRHAVSSRPRICAASSRRRRGGRAPSPSAPPASPISAT